MFFLKTSVVFGEGDIKKNIINVGTNLILEYLIEKTFKNKTKMTPNICIFGYQNF